MIKLRVLSNIFKALTICGAIYVFYSEGRANAGYAVIPMIFHFIFEQWRCSLQNNKKQ